jgi:hypothetical protein
MNKHSASRVMQHEERSGETLSPARRVDLQRATQAAVYAIRRHTGRNKKGKRSNATGHSQRSNPKKSAIAGAACRFTETGLQARVNKAGVRPRRC